MAASKLTHPESLLGVKSKPALESQSQNHSQKRRIRVPQTVAYGAFDCELTLTLKSGAALTPYDSLPLGFRSTATRHPRPY